MSTLRTVVTMPWADRTAVLEAALLCGWARLLLRRPFGQVAPKLGAHGHESTRDEVVAEQRHTARRVKQAISRAARWMPWDCTCLVQAIVARTMLSRRGIDGTLYLGVRQDRAEGLEAHAWIRAGSLLVTGGNAAGSYAVVSVFAFGAEGDDRPRRRWSPGRPIPNDVVSPDASPA